MRRSFSPLDSPRRLSFQRAFYVSRLQRVPLRVILPNLVTLIALCLGVFAIRLAAESRFEYALFAIMGAAILDGVDGRLARALQGTTRFGAELDSLADFIDFGVAPAVLLWFWSLHMMPSLGWLAVLLFVVGSALRLARFNVMLDDPEKPSWMANFFVGMPAPLAAICVLLPLYLHLSQFNIPNSRSFVPFQILYVSAIAFLMVSPIPHFSGKNIQRIPRQFVVGVLFGIMLCALLLATYPIEMLVVFSVSYLLIIPFSMRAYKSYAMAWNQEREKDKDQIVPEAG